MLRPVLCLYRSRNRRGVLAAAWLPGAKMIFVEHSDEIEAEFERVMAADLKRHWRPVDPAHCSNWQLTGYVTKSGIAKF